MNTKAEYIKQRLSLREPLKESLDIVAQLADQLELKKEVDLATELEKVKALYPTCQDFEREFPSLCFSIATGVGKTRLMGAIITYLFLEKGIRNFFILAPNLTIYEKLIEDFDNAGGAKYVFKGISEFVHNKPLVITGDNYTQVGSLFSEEEIRINIFNISKFNRDAAKPRGKEKGKAPKIKRLSEYLGQSYWSYLSGLEDLVVLMDEAHRYHADASKAAINELKPVLGLEMTATPIDEKGNSFQNVVYEYSLAKALDDGKYIKNPAIATRKNFRPDGMSDKDVERMKLEDGISIHKDTKNALQIYAENNDAKLVKPFVLVVCKDTTHATEVFNYINSDAFYGGEYIDKVLQIDSTTKKDDEIERQFVELEDPNNDIEIVIHVNMLKEGWDVSNLYTIIPLRAANAAVLIEQTIGRGLRLPFGGERTGDEKADKLTVVAHDNFEKVIEAAQDPNSILNKMSYIRIEDEDLSSQTVVIKAVSKIEESIQQEENKIETIKDEKKKQTAKNKVSARRAIVGALPAVGTKQGVKKVKDLKKDEIKKIVLEEVRKNVTSTPDGQMNAFVEETVKEAEALYEEVVSEFEDNIIEIPRMDLVPESYDASFADFDLETKSFEGYKLLSEEIKVVELTGEKKTEFVGVTFGAFTTDTPANQIVAEVINYPEVDYDDNADLLHKLATQAVAKVEEKFSDPEDLKLVVRQYRKFIAAEIYKQMKAHFSIGAPTYHDPEVLPFVKIENWNFTTVQEGPRNFKDDIKPVSMIRKLVFSGFKKACHLEYKFDSKTEKDFAIIIEDDPMVLKWLRPAPNQFRIYWAHNSKQYYPDFIVETADGIYMVETKASKDIPTEEVQDKKRAALIYCKYATEFTSKNEGKPWKYLLIPDNEVKLNNSFDYFTSRFEEKLD